jgi:PAS domain S-box-containing protein
MAGSISWIPWRVRWRSWLGLNGPALVVALLLCLGVANVVTKARTGRTVEDGVFWTATSSGVVASKVAENGPAFNKVRPGDRLTAIGGWSIETPDGASRALQLSRDETAVRYTVRRAGTPVTVTIAPRPLGTGGLYFVLAAVGLFTLLVGGAVRLRRSGDPATLHFFWLAVAFAGTLSFSYIGHLDRLDWTFYWADVVATLALPPLFLHFMLVFPERSTSWRDRAGARLIAASAYAVAAVLGVARVAALTWQGASPASGVAVVAALDLADYAFLGVCLLGGFVSLSGALSPTTITARRQRRWIAWGTALGGLPFALFYALPYALGVDSAVTKLFALPLSILPLAYASAIVRYRLLDIEVIVKRSVVYAAAICAIVMIYAGLLKLAPVLFPLSGAAYHWVIALLATLVAVLLAPLVKDATHTLLDRAVYRDRFDYRRALIGFARDLNSDLDLNRLADRLVTRVVETLVVDRMALMIESDAGSHFSSVRAAGFDTVPPPALGRRSTVGASLSDGRAVTLDDPMAAGGFDADEIEIWRDAGLYCFVPCVAKERTIAVLALGRKARGAHLNSEDRALLTAVAGQIATALENARLYRQLQVKAIEFDRLRTFNENILESLDDGLLVFNQHERVLRWNTALEQLYGVSSDEAIGRPIGDLFDASFVDSIRAVRRDSPDGATLSRVPIAARGARDGSALIVNASAVPLRPSEDTDAVGTIVIVEDVTARVQLEEQLQISEKMASIGLLAAGVAHEVNTPLTGISSFTQMLLEGADPEDPRTRLLEKIERQTFRAAKIVNGLLNLSRPADASAERGPLDLNVVITDVLALLEHQFATHRIKVRRELAADPVMVLGMEHKLQQVFLNLFLNAKDAMPKGGWLSVGTRRSERGAIAEVADTGSGIPNEHLTRIYDPFFTTKGIGRGTGLGLSITYGIVREHEGTIDCESAVGQGTRFVLTLPEAVARQAIAAQRQTGVR